MIFICKICDGFLAVLVYEINDTEIYMETTCTSCGIGSSEVISEENDDE